MGKESSSKSHFRNIYQFVAICLKLADLADEKQESPFDDGLHMGYRAFSGYMRGGAKELIDLQNDYYGMKSDAEIAKKSEEEARDFLEKCFADRYIDDINEEDRDRILFLCNKIRREWEAKEEE